MSSFVFISFNRLSFGIHFLLSSFHFALISFHVAFVSFHFAYFMSFHVPSLCIKNTGLRKLICSNWSGGYPPKRLRFFFMFRYRFCSRLAIVLEACARCHLQASWTCTCISLSSLSLFLLLSSLIAFWAVNASQAKMKCPGLLHYPMWVSRLTRPWSAFSSVS